ncbi:MAG: tetratricopeptide repeat protein [bacterium]
MTKVRIILLAGLLVLSAMAGCRSAHTTSAILYIEEQKFDKAVAVLHEGLEYNADEPEAYYYLGEAHSKIAEEAIQNDDYEESKKNYELAYDYYCQARDLAPDKLTERSHLAMQHNYALRASDARKWYGNRDYEQAEGFFRLAFAALPDSISSIKNLARMKMQMAEEAGGDQAIYGEALELLDQVLEARPEAYELLVDKATVLVALERNTEANRIYEDLLSQHSDDATLLIDIATLAASEENYERAADLYIQVAAIYESDTDPENDETINPLLVRSATYLARDDIRRYDEALRHFDRALQLELVPARDTQFEYLRTWHNYGDWLNTQAEDETDTMRKAELEAQAKEKFSRGIEIGNALVEAYPGYGYGYYYLALCQFAIDENAAGRLNMEKFNDLQQNLGD